MLKVYKCKDYAEIPKLATEGSSCFDLQAALKMGDKVVSYNNWNKRVDIPVKIIGGKEAVQIHPDTRMLIPTGLIFDIPENHTLKLFIRSGTALKAGLLLANGTGIIDSDYVEESFMMVYNITDSVIAINNGERLAQAKLEKNIKYSLVEIDEAPKQKTDRDGGFGSTGK